MTPIYSQRIEHPGAWRSAQIGGREGLTHRLGAEHLDAFDRVLRQVRGKTPDDTGQADFLEPEIEDLMRAVRYEIMDGKGAIILSGIDLGRYSLEDFRMLYWGLGTYLGEAAPQSYRRDKIGIVQKEEDNPTGRGYLMDTELRPHTDFHEVLSLACVRKAETGGLSGAVSSLALHNAIFEEAPALLRPLYEGFYHESANGEVSATKVPVFGCVDGKVSCYYHLPFVHKAAKVLGVELPADLQQAVQRMNKLALDPALRADFMLEPGEMLFWHNFTVLHSREAFNDTTENKRMLLRLWINVADGRPMPDEFLDRAKYMDEVHGAGEAAIDYAAATA
jgi:hypothetical protein